jgi:multiple antibiotic resistance protein
MLGANSMLDFAVLSFWSLFAIVDPIATIPTFLAITEKDNVHEKVRMARLASIVAFCVLIAFSLAGQTVLNVFGITVPAFEIAGGIILLIVALDMLRARRITMKETPEEQAEAASKEDIAVTPLAIPMLSGPGAITAVVLLTSQATTVVLHAVVLVNIFLVSLITFLVLRFAAIQSSLISGITLKIITRLMGLLLAAIAIQFILNGIIAAGLW